MDVCRVGEDSGVGCRGGRAAYTMIDAARGTQSWWWPYLQRNIVLVVAVPGVLSTSMKPTYERDGSVACVVISGEMSRL